MIKVSWLFQNDENLGINTFAYRVENFFIDDGDSVYANGDLVW